MTNIRIYQIAQAIRVPSIEVLTTAKTLGLAVRSSSSSVEPLTADAIASRVTGGNTVRLVRVNNKVHMLTRKGDIHNNVDRRFMLLGPLENNPEDWNGSRRTWVICEDLGRRQDTSRDPVLVCTDKDCETFLNHDTDECWEWPHARFYRAVNLVSGETREVSDRRMTNCW